MQEQGIHYAQIGVKTANDIDQAYTEKVLAKIEEVRIRKRSGCSCYTIATEARARALCRGVCVFFFWILVPMGNCLRRIPNTTFFFLFFLAVCS